MDAVQLNVRLPRTVKEQGDATLALVGSSPVKVIRLLWEKLAQGGDAYESIIRVLREDEMSADATQEGIAAQIERSSRLFEGLGASLGLGMSAFSPSSGDPYELIEDEDWNLLSNRGLI